MKLSARYRIPRDAQSVTSGAARYTAWRLSDR